jgi:hypothetical protein
MRATDVRTVGIGGALDDIAIKVLPSRRFY